MQILKFSALIIPGRVCAENLRKELHATINRFVLDEGVTELNVKHATLEVNFFCWDEIKKIIRALQIVLNLLLLEKVTIDL
jgi:hypothetical protein